MSSRSVPSSAVRSPSPSPSRSSFRPPSLGVGFLLLAVLAALALAPAASAQTAHTVTIEIRNLPATAQSNGTALVIPFSVHATVAGAGPCLSSSGTTYTISLSASVVNSTGNRTTANVTPKQYTIAGPVLLPAGGGNAERTQEAQLTIYPGPYSGAGLNATVEVVASFAGGNPGCTGGQASAAAEDSERVQAAFDPVPPLYGDAEDGQQVMPGPGVAALALALGLVALARRRRSL
jgi:uncharacterized protein (TIGR03382 family)